MLFYLLAQPLVQLLNDVILPQLRLHACGYHAFGRERDDFLEIEDDQVGDIFELRDLDVLNVHWDVFDREHIVDLVAVGFLAVDIPGVGQDREVLVSHVLMLSLLELLFHEDAHRHLGHLFVR
jgi:hypothetical protein